MEARCVAQEAGTRKMAAELRKAEEWRVAAKGRVRRVLAELGEVRRREVAATAAMERVRLEAAQQMRSAFEAAGRVSTAAIGKVRAIICRWTRVVRSGAARPAW